MHGMEALKKVLKGRKHLIFFDLEGTQNTHEVIEIGAVGVTIHEDGTVKKVHKGFSCYVKARAPIGHFVTDLTGITQKTLEKQGLLYHDAICQFQKYASRFKGDVLFVSYGNGDISILEQSSYVNFDDGVEFVRNIKKNYLDFAAFFGNFVRSDKGNVYSLTNALKLFDAVFEGTAHDALADAMNLERLYEQFLEQKEVVALLYKQTLSRYHSLPVPVQKVMQALSSGRTVDQETYEQFIKESLD